MGRVDATSLLNSLPGPLSDALLGVSAGRGVAGRLYARATLPFSADDIPTLPTESPRSVRVAIGPVDEVNQAWLWARSLEASHPDLAATSFRVGSIRRPVDIVVPTAVSVRSHDWQRAFGHFLQTRTHVLNESARPMLGRLLGVDAFRELAWLRDAGVATAMIFHGSDIRDPDAHIRREQWSPFLDKRVPRRLLRRRAAVTRRRAIGSGMPLFVTTPDLREDLPSARWCPVVIDPERWHRSPDTSGPPLVVHAPSSGPMKGTAHVTDRMRALEQAGAIRYREVSGVSPDQMRSVFADADIVLDQFLIGSYGVAACEAMAAGAVVVAHVSEAVRREVAEASGHDLPVVEATPETLTEVVRVLASSPTERAARGVEGQAFVRAVHDGRFSSAVLGDFLGV